MNQRIQELAEQAGITTNIDTDYFEKDFNKWVDYYSEKFAELIVKECADIASEIGTNTEPADFALDKCYEIESKIKEHFGVEE